MSKTIDADFDLPTTAVAPAREGNRITLVVIPSGIFAPGRRCAVLPSPAGTNFSELTGTATRCILLVDADEDEDRRAARAKCASPRTPADEACDILFARARACQSRQPHEATTVERFSADGDATTHVDARV